MYVYFKILINQNNTIAICGKTVAWYIWWGFQILRRLKIGTYLHKLKVVIKE